MLIIYKKITKRKKYYTNAAIIGIKFDYTVLMLTFIILCIIASIVWFDSNTIFAISILLLAVLILIGLIVYLYFNHYITKNIINGDKLRRYIKVRRRFAIIVTLLIILLDILPYII